jgi:predicted flap endonuclease-1-like 5' DNA nuclease
MKNGWIIFGLLLLLIASVSLLIYPWAQGMVMDVTMLVIASLLIIGSFILVGCIALLAGWLPQKKTTEPKPQSPVIQPTKAEPSHLTEEIIEEKPSPTLVKEMSNRGSKIIDVEGIGPVYAEKLNAINIYTTADLLEAGATPLGRKGLAEKTGISGSLILRWVNIADLFRIKGVGEEYSDLLEAAGVDTVVELAKRVPENLHAKMLEVNEKKKLVRRPPSLNEVTQWIEEAKKLPRKIEY